MNLIAIAALVMIVLLIADIANIRRRLNLPSIIGLSILAGALALPGVALAQGINTPLDVAWPAPVGAPRGILDALLPGLCELGITAITLWVALLWKKFRQTEIGQRLATTAIEAAVAEVWDEFVQDLKAKAADGKLTAAERREAQNLAISKAMGIVEHEGQDLLNIHSERMIKALINRAVQASGRFQTLTVGDLTVSTAGK